jgi:thiol-disulfide isomerase/thioredoxin
LISLLYSIVTDLALDKNDDARLRLNFNITMTDLKCEWAVIDVVSVLGTDQNVDGNGVRRGYKGRNRNQKDIALFDETVTETLEELHSNGEDAISLDEDTLNLYKKEHDYLFVDFYASWCSHCHDLAPTWEVLAEVMVDAGQQLGKQHPDDYSDKEYEEARKVQMPVVIAKVDCVQHPKVCNDDQNIQGYPTLRLFVDGEPWRGGDYRGHRTIIEMVEWLYYMEEQHKQLMDNDENVRTLHTVHQGKMDRE